MSDTLYERYNTGNNDYYSFGATVWYGQTFTTTDAISVSSVKFILGREESPGTITVSIRAVDVDGKPTGSDLAYGTKDCNSIAVSPLFEWVEITFETPVSLDAATQYAVVIRATEIGEGYVNLVRVRAKLTSPSYDDGVMVGSDDSSGDTWWIESGADFMFQVWGVQK